MAMLLLKCFLYKPKAHDEELWIISTASLIVILLYLTRQGNYFINGFPFFLWMFYFAWKQNKAGKAAENGEGIPQPNLQVEVN